MAESTVVILLCSLVGAVLVAIVIILAIFLWRRKQQRFSARFKEKEAMDPREESGNLNLGYASQHFYLNEPPDQEKNEFDMADFSSNSHFYINEPSEVTEQLKHLREKDMSNSYFYTDEVYSEAEDRLNRWSLPIGAADNLDKGEKSAGSDEESPQITIPTEPHYFELEREGTDEQAQEDSSQYFRLEEPAATSSDLHPYVVLENPNEGGSEPSGAATESENPEDHPHNVLEEPHTSSDLHQYVVLEDPNEGRSLHEGPKQSGAAEESENPEDHPYNVLEDPSEAHEYGVLQSARCENNLYHKLLREPSGQQFEASAFVEENPCYEVSPETRNPVDQNTICIQTVGPSENDEFKFEGAEDINRPEGLDSSVTERQPVYQELEEPLNENTEGAGDKLVLGELQSHVDDQPIYGNVMDNEREDTMYGNVDVEHKNMESKDNDVIVAESHEACASNEQEGGEGEEWGEEEGEEDIFVDVRELMTAEEKKQYKNTWRQSCNLSVDRQHSNIQGPTMVF